ncbi:PDZ domain-containing protein [Thalassotalea sp. G2M2-11]|uniref:PDZ domain-containing protein n=1 Tax=Thalassotalea sp. G2M2-11 TaxID=2787627 RepID=UPI0019CFC4E0|nr:PDZ domain-containing protein [Thalassotalea sp. G2M2-11]
MNVISTRTAVFAMFIGSLPVGSAYAQKCTHIDLVNEQEATTYLKIVDIDNQTLALDTGFKAESTHYTVTEGTKVFTILETPKELYKFQKRLSRPSSFSQSFERNRKARKKYAQLFEQQKVHQFVLPLVSDKNYTIGLNENDAVDILLVSDRQCAANTQLTTKKSYKPVIEDVKNLPSVLRRSLDNIMLAYEKQAKTEEAISHFSPLSVYQFFGAVVDDKYSKDNNIKVLTVLPNTLAFNLGLRSNDEITGLSNNERLSPNELLANYLRENNQEQQLTLSIKRNGKTQTLKGDNQPTIIPSSWFALAQGDLKGGVIKDSLKESQLDEQYNTLMLMLKRYFETSEHSDGRITLINSQRRNASLGVKGKELKQKGLLITSIEANSPLAKLGLRQGDIITEIVGVSGVVDKVNLLTQFTDGLTPSQSFALNIERNGNKQMLAGNYLNDFIPSYQLTVDLDSTEAFQQRLLARAENPSIWDMTTSLKNHPYFHSQRANVYSNKAEAIATRGTYSNSGSYSKNYNGGN